MIIIMHILCVVLLWWLNVFGYVHITALWSDLINSALKVIVLYISKSESSL
jgi:hypothetical protein